MRPLLVYLCCTSSGGCTATVGSNCRHDGRHHASSSSFTIFYDRCLESNVLALGNRCANDRPTTAPPRGQKVIVRTDGAPRIRILQNQIKVIRRIASDARQQDSSQFIVIFKYYNSPDNG